MENGKFVIDLDNIHSVLEIGQVRTCVYSLIEYSNTRRHLFAKHMGIQSTDTERWIFYVICKVAVHSGTNLFLHSDPVSRRNNTVNDEVREELFSSFFVPLTWAGRFFPPILFIILSLNPLFPTSYSVSG